MTSKQLRNGSVNSIANTSKDTTDTANSDLATMSDPEDVPLERSISAPEPGDYTYEDAHSIDPAILSAPASPSINPSLMPRIFTQLSFSLDSFISQNLEEDFTDLPVLASQVYNNLRSDLSKTKHQLSHHVDTTKRQIRHQVDNTANNLKSQVDTSIMIWKKNMKKASVVRFMDKVAFTLGMFECCCTPWLVSQYPEWIPLDKVTSVYIHMSPPVTLYVVRWLYPDPDHTRYPALKNMDVLPTVSSLQAAIALYLTWQVAYYLFVVVIKRDKVKAGKRVTSYTWLLNDPHGGMISRAAHTFGEKYSILTFMGLQLIYTFVTCLFALLLYRNFKLNTMFLVSLFIVSVWNGASYYMEVFSKQYEKQLSKLAVEVSSAVAANQLARDQSEEHRLEQHLERELKSETDKKND
ncbi:hypothetical protein BGZ98_009688 [Dissophora globulifera]|nr:hypothetical protein BGZ98_009688 [Dissophora globulifera]